MAVRNLGALLTSLVVGVGCGGGNASVNDEIEVHSTKVSSRTLAESSDFDCPKFLEPGSPGLIPRPFAPGVFVESLGRLHGGLVFSADGRRVCWSVLPPAIVSMECTREGWSTPEILPLPGRAVQAPAFSPDGSRLYYQAVGEGGRGGLDLWWVDPLSGDWSHAVNLGVPVNGPGLQSQPAVSGQGDLFFTGSMPGVGFDRGIFFSEKEGDGFRTPQPLPAPINTQWIDYCPFISSDGKTLLFASSRGHEGEELFIHAAFRRGKGWSEPLNLHSMMGYPGNARFPTLSPDGTALFFLAGGKFWWVDSTILQRGPAS